MIVSELSAQKQALLRHYAEGCYERSLKCVADFKPIEQSQWIANCMQDALDHIGKSESWERIQQVVDRQTK